MKSDNDTEISLLPHLNVVLVMTLAFLLVTIASSLCLLLQFEYRRKKRQSWKSLPSSGYSTPNPSINGTIRKFKPETSTEDLLATPGPAERRHLRLKFRLKKASRIIRGHFATRPPFRRRTIGLSRSLSETHVGLESTNEMVPLIPHWRLTGNIVKKALQIKSKRYRRGHYKPLNRPRTPASTPFLKKRHSRSLSDISSLLSIPQISNDANLMQDDLLSIIVKVVPESESELSRLTIDTVQDDSYESYHRRRRFLSRTAKEKLSERRNKRLMTSEDSLATLKPTTSVSEFSEQSYHSGDPELEFDLYDCDLNNVSTLPGSMFAPAIYYDMPDTPTGTEEELEMTELFPMLRSNSDNNPRRTKGMVDSLTSDLAVSMTSEDLTFDRQEDEETLYGGEETDNLLSKKPVLNLTLIEDEVSFVDE